MPLSDAFNGGSADFLESDQVPDITTKKYASAWEKTHDERLLKHWLKQLGLTDAEIARKSSERWAFLKKNYYDLGKVPPVHHLLGVPAADQNESWAGLLEKYGITEAAQQSEIRTAFSKFSRGYNFRLDDIPLTVRQNAQGQSEFFDSFLRQFMDSMRVGSDFTDIHNDVFSLRGKIADLTSEEATGVPEALDEILEYSFSDTPSDGERSTWDMFLGGDDFSTGPPLPDDLSNYIASEMRRVNNPDPLFGESYLEREQARVDNPKPLFDDPPQFPENPMQEVHGARFAGEEELRAMMWDNPGASYEEMLIKLQGNAIMKGESLTDYSFRVYGRPPEQAFKHVYDIWDQEVDLKQALRRVIKAFPDDSTAARLAHRVQDSRQPPIEHNSSMAEYFENNRMRLINDLVDDKTGWVDFKEERTRLINLMDEGSEHWANVVDDGRTRLINMMDEGGEDWADEGAQEGFLDEDDGKATELLGDGTTLDGEYRSPLEPEPLKITEIEAGGRQIEIVGLDPVEYMENKTVVDEFFKTAVKDQGFLARFQTSLSGKITIGLGGLAVGMAAGMGVNALLHNTTQTFLLSVFGMLSGDPLAAFGTGMIYYGALKDWERRSKKIDARQQNLTRKEPGLIMFVRGANDKWIPAILRTDREPGAFLNPVDLTGDTAKWQGVHKLVYQTGYGLTYKDGKLEWMHPGTVSQLYVRAEDMAAGNQERWKPWLQYFIPKVRERDEDGVPYNEDESMGQQDYIGTGLLKPIDAVPLQEIYDSFGSSDAFKSMVELIHFSHLHQHALHKYTGGIDRFAPLADPFFATTWQPSEYKSTPDFPETFQDGYEWRDWENADVASLLSWWFEISNPDNWWQRQSKWRKSHDSRDYINKVTQKFVEDIRKQYAGLSHFTKTELDRESVERIPQTAADMSKRMHAIQNDRMLSEEAKQFRIAQEQARFFARHTYRIAYSGGGDFTHEFEDLLGPDFLKYKQSTYDFAELHPDEFVTQEFREDGSRTFHIMFGETAHTFETRNNTSLGYWSLPPVGKDLPSFTKTSRAVIAAHNQSALPRIGGPLKKDVATFGGVVGTIHDNDPLATVLGATKTVHPTKPAPATPFFTAASAPQDPLLTKLLAEST